MKSKKILALFPGQGSQKVGMGADLFESFEIARSLFATADKVLGFPLSEFCFKGPAEKLTSTEIAQPAILTVSVICYRLAQEALGRQLTPVAAAGHSLGEYSALVASGALSFEDAVLLVHKRGKFMQEAVPQGQGKMYAILGKEVAEIEAAIAQVTEGIAQIANINAPGQIVVAGDVAGTAALLQKMPGTKSIELPVSAPFHCSMMKPAEVRLAKELSAVTFNRSAFPVYANFSASAIQEPAQIREHLVNQVCGRVRWVESMQRAIEETKPEIAVEFGSGNVLSGMLKRIAPTVARENVGSSQAVQALTAQQ